MKKALFSLILFLFAMVDGSAQLNSVVITSHPCSCYAGSNGTVTCTYIPGATYYRWKADTVHTNAVWFNGSPGPVQTAGPGVSISCQLSTQSLNICVTAFNATDSSNTACVTLWNIVDMPVFSASNSPLGVPGDSSLYSLDTPQHCPPAGYTWTLSGDVTFSNGLQQITTSSYLMPVMVSFGLGFTSGVLCVQAFSTFGLFSDTTCMIITAPSGIEYMEGNDMSLIYLPQTDQIAIQLPANRYGKFEVGILDRSGRRIESGMIQVDPGQGTVLFPVPESLSNGLYVVEVNGEAYRTVQKVVILE